MTIEFRAQHTTALRSAVDLLSGCVSPDYIESVLADYRCGGNRHELAVSLYALIDAMEANDAKYVDPF